ncbi:MAG: glycerol-3-phosphate acyltransferase [Chloroflexi bacterium]|nr:glycerol-3-phosphate acyltransferase [Chloroflexota bacterium]
MIVLYFLLAGLIGYLSGSIPFGFIYVKLFKGIDIRDVGSGRTGGTNSLRAAGLGVGLLTSFSDVFKGTGAVLLVRFLFAPSVDTVIMPWVVIVAGIFSVVGHNWSVFLKFRGGAGTGPNVGWGTGVWWPMLPIGIVVMVGLLVGVGMASVASMAMAAVIPITFLILYLAGVAPYDSTLAYFIGGLISATIVVWALRPNIKRLFNGTERIVGPRAKRMKKASKQ